MLFLDWAIYSKVSQINPITVLDMITSVIYLIPLVIGLAFIRDIFTKKLKL
jgi:capsular polysaccharide biosynthesis protein